MGLARNHYAGRTFIQPTTYQREFVVRMKLHPIREIIRDKRIILVDDSLVRGTTSKTIVKFSKTTEPARFTSGYRLQQFDFPVILVLTSRRERN